MCVCAGCVAPFSLLEALVVSAAVGYVAMPFVLEGNYLKNMLLDMFSNLHDAYQRRPSSNWEEPKLSS